jgi:two-component system, cell cycle sensor histidine kinase and response regulator CckA
MCIAPIEDRIEWIHKTRDGQVPEVATILFVEDEAFVREATCEVLRSAGYAVLAARDADEAAGLYDEHCGEVDLLLADVVLPGESGPVLAGKLRRRNPSLRTLFVTGYVEQMEKLKTWEEEWLAKPFSLETLLDNVRRMLDLPEFPRTECVVMPACESVPLA